MKLAHLLLLESSMNTNTTPEPAMIDLTRISTADIYTVARAIIRRVGHTAEVIV